MEENKKVEEFVYVPVNEIKKLEWYAWDIKGMKQRKKGVPIEDVFVMRQDVLDLIEKGLITCDVCNGLGFDSYHDTAYPTCRSCNGSGKKKLPISSLLKDLVSSDSNSIREILNFLKKKQATNRRKWNRAQTTSDKIRFGCKARMCSEIIDYLLNKVPNVQVSDTTKPNQGEEAK